MTDETASSAWLLDPSVVFLNHGSFGACPRPVLDLQSDLRVRMEREPVHFFNQQMEPLVDAARAAVAGFVDADPADLVFVRNATSAVGAVLSSLRFAPGDELLRTDHGYNACNNGLLRAASQAGAKVVVAAVPFPLSSPGQVVDAIVGAVTPRTRLALIDHVTSPTGLVLPIAQIVDALAARGIDTLVDGAHAPGMLPLSLRTLGAAYYAGNLHKWCCAPKGAAFLHVRRDRQAGLHPAVTSHGMNVPRTDRSRFQLEFDWIGSDDYTSVMAVPAALRFLASLSPDGLPGVMAENRARALGARSLLCQTLAIAPPCPDDMIGALVAVPLPPRAARERLPQVPVPLHIDPLQAVLYERHRIQVPVMPWPSAPSRLLRISAQRYNRTSDYQTLAAALRDELSL